MTDSVMVLVPAISVVVAAVHPAAAIVVEAAVHPAASIYHTDAVRARAPAAVIGDTVRSSVGSDCAHPVTYSATAGIVFRHRVAGRGAGAHGASSSARRCTALVDRARASSAP